MTKTLFSHLMMNNKKSSFQSQCFHTIKEKCFSPASKIRLLHIIVDPLEIREEVKVVHPTGSTTPELNEEIEEEVGNIIALPFPRMSAWRW